MTSSWFFLGQTVASPLKGQAFNIPNRSAQFRDDNIYRFICFGIDACFDLIGDMGNHLNGILVGNRLSVLSGELSRRLDLRSDYSIEVLPR